MPNLESTHGPVGSQFKLVLDRDVVVNVPEENQDNSPISDDKFQVLSL